MKLLSLAALVAVVSTGCAGSAAENHWRVTSVPQRVGYHFFGYEAQEDGSYWNRLGNDAGAFWTTLERHFWMGNPDNPRMPYSSDPPPKPQPPNREFHVENENP
jgi:hypothetical protein